MNTTAEPQEMPQVPPEQVLCEQAPPTQVTRRRLLGGILAAAIAPTFLSRAWAGRPPQEPTSRKPTLNTARTRTVTAGIPRCQHASASLKNGCVLVAGGRRHSALPASVPPIAGVQIYDTQAGVWTTAASMKMARAQHVAVSLPDGRVLVAGGLGHAPLTSVEIYDPIADAWTAVSAMPLALSGHSAACLGGEVIVSGGFSGGPPQSSLQIYDIARDTWRIVG